MKNKTKSNLMVYSIYALILIAYNIFIDKCTDVEVAGLLGATTMFIMSVVRVIFDKDGKLIGR